MMEEIEASGISIERGLRGAHLSSDDVYCQDFILTQFYRDATEGERHPLTDLFIARYRALEAFIVSLPPLPSFMASASPSPSSSPQPHTRDSIHSHSSSQNSIPLHLASSFVLAHGLARASIVRSHAQLADANGEGGEMNASSIKCLSSSKAIVGGGLFLLGRLWGSDKVGG